MSRVILSAKVETQENRLTVHCSLKNETTKSIWIFVVLWSVAKNGQAVLDSHPAYVSLDEEQILQIGKIVYPCPELMFVEERLVPFAKSLPAGQTWQDKLEFELPVKEYSPYYLDTDTTLWDEVSIRAIRVCVDVVDDLVGLKQYETPIAGAFRLAHPELLEQIRRYSSDKISCSAPALRRADEFERFSC